MILEKLKGGGHYDQAAAQVSDMSIDETLEALINAIDEYYDENKEKKDEDN
jgi:c-di-AMP phosphodiesterase-like protein